MVSPAHRHLLPLPFQYRWSGGESNSLLQRFLAVSPEPTRVITRPLSNFTGGASSPVHSGYHPIRAVYLSRKTLPIRPPPAFAARQLLIRRGRGRIYQPKVVPARHSPTLTPGRIPHPAPLVLSLHILLGLRPTEPRHLHPLQAGATSPYHGSRRRSHFKERFELGCRIALLIGLR